MTEAQAGGIGGVQPGASGWGAQVMAGAMGERASTESAAQPSSEVELQKTRRTPPIAYVIGGLLALGLLWRVVAVNLSAHYTENAIDEGTNSLGSTTSAIAWDRDNAVALARDAALDMERDPAAAVDRAKRALRGNPATASAYLVLAGIAQNSGDVKSSIAFFKRAAELEPQNPTTRLALANLALEDHDLAAALENMDATLRARPELNEQLFPKMLSMLQQPGGEAALKRLFAQRIPQWWPGFFDYATQSAPVAAFPLRLLDVRRGFAPRVTSAERGPVVDRLAQSNEWTAAYVVWLNGLDTEQRQAVGNVYNGGFEAPLTSTTFDWRWTVGNGADIAALATFGTGGGRALRVALQGQISNPRLVTQTLLLPTGYHYDLRGRYRLESVRTQFGLEWRVTCGSAPAQDVTPLVSSDRLVGSSDWKEFQATFSVPESCYPQQLALTLIGDAKLDLQANGLAWYDEIQVVRGSSLLADNASDTALKPDIRKASRDGKVNAAQHR